MHLCLFKYISICINIYTSRDSDLLYILLLLLLLFSHPVMFWLFATLWIGAHQAPLSMQFSKQEYWSGLPCPPPGDLPDSETEHVILSHLTNWKVHTSCIYILLYILNIFPTFPTSKDFDLLHSQGLGSYSVWGKKKKQKCCEVFCRQSWELT